MTSVWVAGGLCHAGLRLAVLGRSVTAVPAELADAALPGALVCNLTDDDIARLRHYATVVGAVCHDDAVGTTAGPAGARYLDTCQDIAPEDVALAEDVMQLFGVVAPGRLARRISSLRVGAASRLRAEATVVRERRVGTGEVTEVARRVPHAGFFAVAEVALAYRRFDGRMSGQLTREIFLAGDAVTVLPYDPVRDRVLLIEQMRMGPYGRGDPLPWQLEAIAGRIDAGETPEDCARREAVEEAGLALGLLEKVAEYYPTPGAASEYLYSYVALCDLPDGVAGVFGMADEAEDIRGHLVGFDDLMALVAVGEVANAPLLLTALWLQRERGRLRQHGV